MTAGRVWDALTRLTYSRLPATGVVRWAALELAGGDIDREHHSERHAGGD